MNLYSSKIFLTSLILKSFTTKRVKKIINVVVTVVAMSDALPEARLISVAAELEAPLDTHWIGATWHTVHKIKRDATTNKIITRHGIRRDQSST